MDLDDKGRKTPVFSTNVFIISRGRKGNRIRQENRISIILILTERIVMLYTPSTYVFSWKRIFFLTRWRQGGQSKKRGSWKVKTQAERALFSAWKLLHWGEARKTENMSQTKVTKFCLFIPEKDKTQGSTDPVSTVASWKGHPCGEKLHFWPYALSFSTSYLHPWVLHVHGTEVTISHCQTCAQSQQLLSCKHCQEAFLLAFFKATPIWHPSFTALCFLTSSFSSHKLLLQIAGSLLLKAAWDGLPPFGSLEIQNNDMFVTFVNRSHSKETVLLTAPGEMMPQWQASF